MQAIFEGGGRPGRGAGEGVVFVYMCGMKRRQSGGQWQSGGRAGRQNEIEPGLAPPYLIEEPS